MSQNKVDSEVPVDSLIVTSSLAFLFGWGAGYKYHSGDDKIAGLFLTLAIIIVLLGVIIGYSDKYDGVGIEIAIAVASLALIILGIVWYNRRKQTDFSGSSNPDFDMRY
jgi:hypothetical protein